MTAMITGEKGSACRGSKGRVEGFEEEAEGTREGLEGPRGSHFRIRTKH